MRYEGYGPGGAAVLIDCGGAGHAADVLRVVFAAHGGHLGARDSVAYLFNEAGVLRFASPADPEGLARIAVAAGAEDVVVEGAAVLVVTDPPDLAQVHLALRAAGFEAGEALVTHRPAIRVSLTGAAARQMRALLAELGTVQDVRGVYTNAEFPDEFLAAV